jgi:ABC-type multidrug transport system fused ATPase/permease subunit
MKRYAALWIIVLVCLLLSVFANTQGTMFIQSLIDDYITPLVENGGKDYGPLVAAMSKVAGFYAIGIIAAWVQQKLLIYISQGSIKHMRDDLFSHMQDLPIRYFDTHAHNHLCAGVHDTLKHPAYDPHAVHGGDHALCEQALREFFQPLFRGAAEKSRTCERFH